MLREQNLDSFSSKSSNTTSPHPIRHSRDTDIVDMYRMYKDMKNQRNRVPRQTRENFKFPFKRDSAPRLSMPTINYAIFNVFK